MSDLLVTLNPHLLLQFPDSFAPWRLPPDFYCMNV